MRTEVFTQKTFILLPGFSEEMMSLRIIVLDVSAKGLDQWQVSSLKQQVINVIKLYNLGHSGFQGTNVLEKMLDTYAKDRKRATQEDKWLLKL